MNRSVFGRKLDNQAKQMAFNVYRYFRKRKLDSTTLEYQQDINVNKAVAEATGLSVKSVSRILQERRTMKDDESFETQSSPIKTKKQRKKRIHVDDSTREVIKTKVTQFYTLYNKVPTLKALNDLLREENILHCGREYLRLLLQDLGFSFERRNEKLYPPMENASDETAEDSQGKWEHKVEIKIEPEYCEVKIEKDNSEIQTAKEDYKIKIEPCEQDMSLDVANYD